MAFKDYTAIQNMANEVFADEIFGFHAQQAVEKALKAWLAALGAGFPFTHDLVELFALIKQNKQELPLTLLELRDLVDFAVQYRYDDFDDEKGLNRAETLQRTKELLLLAQSKIEELAKD